LKCVNYHSSVWSFSIEHLHCSAQEIIKLDSEFCSKLSPPSFHLQMLVANWQR
jgi:hypothetical protein